jgi:hypothetical protein
MNRIRAGVITYYHGCCFATLMAINIDLVVLRPLPIDTIGAKMTPRRAACRVAVPVSDDPGGYAMPTKAKRAGRTAVSAGKSAVRRIASASKAAGTKVGRAAASASDLNKDGKVDKADAKIAGAKVRRVTSKAADKAGALAKKAGKHDMVRDAAAGAAIGAVVAIPVPVVGPVAGAAIGAIVGVAKNLRSAGNRAPKKKTNP